MHNCIICVWLFPTARTKHRNMFMKTLTYAGKQTRPRLYRVCIERASFSVHLVKLFINKVKMQAACPFSLFPFYKQEKLIFFILNALVLTVVSPKYFLFYTIHHKYTQQCVVVSCGNNRTTNNVIV